MESRTTTTKPLRRGQQGVTLLITLMIMAALSAVVFSISAIALNEVHVAENESGSEPAITAAKGLAEEQLFQNVRGINTTCASTGSEPFTVSGVTGAYVTSFYNNGAYDFSLASAQEQDFYLYNPCNLSGGQTYSSVTVQESSGSVGTATVYICTWTADCKTGYIDIGSTTPGGSVTFTNVDDIDASQKYQIAVVYSTTPSAGSFAISTTSTDPTVTGIPTNQITITTTGSKNGATRKLQTVVPQ